MPYNAEPGHVAYVTFTKACTHGDLVTENNLVGVAVKQQTPAADAPRATRASIAIGEAGLLRIQDVVEAPATGALAGVAKGTLVTITASSNALGTAAVAAGILPVGRVVSLPGERGTPSDKVRINLRLKV